MFHYGRVIVEGQKGQGIYVKMRGVGGIGVRAPQLGSTCVEQLALQKEPAKDRGDRITVAKYCKVKCVIAVNT